MNNVLSEKDYQKFLLERLADNGYVIRKASHFDRLFAMDREMLMKFLADTQPDTMEKLYHYTIEFFRSLDIPVRSLECCSGDLADEL